MEVCTANPGVFSTGFNDRGAETMMRWFDPERSLSRPELLQALVGGLENQLDPQIMIDALVKDALVKIAEEAGSKLRNVVPDEVAEWIKAIQAKTWEAAKDDALWIDPAAM
ncbi:MAG: hypothetical protein OXG04_07360 [Acidobacteria bacterium]|nr:hypothetical protein [Acidobacteriota bacterium]